MFHDLPISANFHRMRRVDALVLKRMATPAAESVAAASAIPSLPPAEHDELVPVRRAEPAASPATP